MRRPGQPPAAGAAGGAPGPAEPPEPPELRVVGRVVKAHGLRGELVVEPRTDNVDARFAPDVVLHVASRHPGTPDTLTVTAARRHGDRLLVTVAEVDGREAADALRSATLSAPALVDAPADPDEFHDHQLEGLRVELADGTVVGTVTEVQHGAGADLLVVARSGGGETLVPFVTAIVPTVDVAAGRIVLDPPEGLLDE